MSTVQQMAVAGERNGYKWARSHAK